MKAVRWFVHLTLAAAFALPAAAQPVATPPADAATLFQNVRVFDGKGAPLSAPSFVLVRGNHIERISATPIPADPGANTVVIMKDGGVYKNLIPAGR